MYRQVSKMLAGLWRNRVPHSRPQVCRVRPALEELEVRRVLSTTSLAVLPPAAQQLLGDIQARFNVVQAELHGGARFASRGGLNDVRANLRTALAELQAAKAQILAGGVNPK